MLCEQIVNSDQSLMEEETLEAIYLGKKEDNLTGHHNLNSGLDNLLPKHEFKNWL